MRPNAVDRTVVQGGDLSTGMFGLSSKGSDQAHILSILRDRLYTNKILAVLREYTTNAWDAHVESGIADKPIKVVLPTYLSPVLIVRDYGKGLAEEDIYAVYTQYGASTKRESDEMVGMLGIGAKSAFSYSDSFTITSFHGGKKKLYVAALDASNMGKMTKMFEEDSDETGVEVQIPANPNDEHLFVKEARTLFPFFRPLPIVNTKLIDLSDKALETDAGFLLSAPVESLSRWTARMGCVPYRLDFRSFDFQDHNALIEFTNKISGCLYFKLGEVDITASREELEYTPKTKAAVIARLYELRAKQEEALRNFIIQQPPGLSRRLAAKKMESTLGLKLPAEWVFLLRHKVRLYNFVTNDGKLFENVFKPGEEEDTVPFKAYATRIKTIRVEKALENKTENLGETVRSVKTFIARRVIRDRNGRGRAAVEVIENADVTVLPDMEFFYVDEPDRRKIKYYDRVVQNEHYTLIDPVDGATFEEVQEELDAILIPLELTGVKLRKLTELHYYAPTTRKSVYSPQYRALVFTWNRSPNDNSNAWEIEPDPLPVNGVFTILRGFRSEYGLSEMLEDRSMFAELTPLESFPTIYGVKYTEKNPVSVDTIRGVPYPVWRAKKVIQLLDENVEVLEHYRNYQELRGSYPDALLNFRQVLGDAHPLVKFLMGVHSIHAAMLREEQRHFLWALGRLSQLAGKPESGNLARFEKKYPLITSLPGALGNGRSEHWARYIQLIDKYGA